jgi:hypothetical protein
VERMKEDVIATAFIVDSGLSGKGLGEMRRWQV